MRTANWRYIRYENGTEELYHNAKDPHEWTNLADDPAHQSRLISFRQQLASRIPQPGSTPPPQPAFKPKKAQRAAQKPEAKRDAAYWKDEYFKRHPEADANRDGVLSWPEHKAHKAKRDDQ